MLKIALCDDDKNFLKTEYKLIESQIINQNLDAEIVLATTSQREIYNLMYKDGIDILFLDIDFGNNKASNFKNGIDFANDLREINKNFYLIFLTGFQRYMPISFTVKVFDYILKPINEMTMADLIHRIKKEVDTNPDVFFKINKWQSIKTEDILFIEKQGSIAIFYTSQGKYTNHQTLEKLLDMLPNNFCKCHRSYIINENKIVGIDKKQGYVYFENNLRCPINSKFKI